MQLPESPRQHDLERASLRALEAVLPLDKFQLRDVGGGDYGSDRMAELRLNGGRSFSNIRFHIQIKATEKDANADGSHSFTLKVSTYNYLRNQPNSIVVIHLPSLGIFKWGWVDEIWRAAKEGGVDFDTTDQETFTYPFRRALDAAACDEIHALVHERAVLNRRLAETFVLAAPGSRPDLLVEQGASVTDLAKLEADLKLHGFGLVNLGRLDVLEAMLARLPGKSHSDPTVRCVVAFARLGQGRYQESLAALPRAHELAQSPRATRQLCAYVTATARKGLGLVTNEQLAGLLQEAKGLAPDSMLAVQMELHEARDRFLACRDQDAAPVEFERFRAVCERVRKASADDEHSRLIVSITQWEYRGIGLSGSIMHVCAARGMQTALGVSSGPQHSKDLERLNSERQTLLAEALTLEDSVRKNGSPFLQADLALAYGRVHAQHLFVVHGLGAMGMLTPDLASTRDVSMIAAQRARWAAEVLERLRCLEYACRARLLEAELRDVIDDTTGRDTAAARARDLAQDIDSVLLARLAEDTLAGRFPLRELESAIRAVAARPDNDTDLATPRERDHFTRDIMRSLGIPADRFPIARKVVEDDARAAAERRSFCQHLQLREEPMRRDPATMYSRAPKRQGYCALLEHRSKFPHDDGVFVLESFKKAYCIECGRRSVRNTLPSAS